MQWSFQRVAWAVAALCAAAALVAVGGGVGSVVFARLSACKAEFLLRPYYGFGVYCAVFTLGAVLLLPYAPYCIAVGYVWGLWVGLFVQTLAVFVSCAFMYAFVTCFFKGKLRLFLEDRHVLLKLWLQRIETDQTHAAKVNFLTCFVPMPYAVHPYLFAVTASPFLQFVCVFEVGMLPHTLLNLTVGAAIAWEGSAEGHNREFSLTYALCLTVLIIGMLGAVWWGTLLARDVLVVDKGQLIETEIAHATGQHEATATLCDGNVVAGVCSIDDNGNGKKTTFAGVDEKQ